MMEGGNEIISIITVSKTSQINPCCVLCHPKLHLLYYSLNMDEFLQLKKKMGSGFHHVSPSLLLPVGDGVAEALVLVPFTSQSPPPAAQLQAAGQLVAGG